MSATKVELEKAGQIAQHYRSRSFGRRHGLISVPITPGGTRRGTGGTDLRLVAVGVDLDRVVDADVGSAARLRWEAYGAEY